MPMTNFKIDVGQISTVWFQSTASRTFGSQFTLSIPFTFQGTVPTGQTLLNSITSVAVTVSNGHVGTSNSIQVMAHQFRSGPSGGTLLFFVVKEQMRYPKQRSASDSGLLLSSCSSGFGFR